MTSKLGIIGFPIGHSISPVFQQAALDHLGMDATYQAWEVDPGDIASFIQGLRSPDTLGINVTVPHKEAVIPYLEASALPLPPRHSSGMSRGRGAIRYL